ncbi:serine carboxypeptidase S28 [Trypanosoma grayi]|uniref:serine carboxypeptidase S28 n=1 Tax=Trypanosoma grayi TaxID=71804 RepID=UPI0004F40518|nr:serine carboxypeptidase S28 [Trypanosoma grayi]KEG12956.1 serine carboxypeptidase S28 [Trypanosoma grayi]
MLYIPGEGPGRSSPTGYPGLYGHQRQMLLFSLENRYYGESLPAPLTDKMKIKKFLSVDAALDDLRYFQTFVEGKLVGKKLRWLIVGGSYAGALSVWFKVKYPTAALAVWSSSGVVEPRFNFYAYDGHVKAEIPPDCTRSVTVVQSLFLDMWENASTRIEFLNRFGIPHYFDKAGISYMLADAVAGAVQYGKKWQMCDMIVPQNKTDPLGQFLKMIIRMYGLNFTSGCSFSTVCLSNASMSDQWASADYSWVYQTCRELAYFQVGYHKSLRLEDVNTEYFVDQCRSAFGASVFPDVFEFNAKWGGKRPNAGNVVALQGSDDPWSELGVTKTLRTNYQAFVAECEGCGHCGDLGLPGPEDPPSLTQQRIDLSRCLDIWMSGEPTPYHLLLHGNFTRLSLMHEEMLMKVIQSDLHDFFDHSADVHSITIDIENWTLSIRFVAYVNTLNNGELAAAVTSLQSGTSWLRNMKQVLARLGSENEVIVLSFEQLIAPSDLEERESTFYIGVAMRIIVFISLIINLLVTVEYSCIWGLSIK